MVACSLSSQRSRMLMQKRPLFLGPIFFNLYFMPYMAGHEVPKISHAILLVIPPQCSPQAFSRASLSERIERFHSRGQHLCKFIETKESVCIGKEFNYQRIGLGHQHGHRFIVLGHQYGRRDVMLKHSTLEKGLCKSLLVMSRRVHVWRNGEGLGTRLMLFLFFPKTKR